MCLQCSVALLSLQVAGLPTNLAFLQDLSAHPAFDQLDLDTGFIERHRKTLLAAEEVQPDVAAVAAVLWSKLTVSLSCCSHKPRSLKGSSSHVLLVCCLYLKKVHSQVGVYYKGPLLF